jgi:hypothetical protein
MREDTNAAMTTLSIPCPICGTPLCGHVHKPGKLAAAAMLAYPDESDRALAKALGVGHATVSAARASVRNQTDTPRQVTRGDQTYTYRPPARPEQLGTDDADRTLIPISSDEIKALYENADPAIRDWLAVYAGWPKRTKDAAYKLFLNLNTIGDI